MGNATLFFEITKGLPKRVNNAPLGMDLLSAQMLSHSCISYCIIVLLHHCLSSSQISVLLLVSDNIVPVKSPVIIQQLTTILLRHRLVNGFEEGVLFYQLLGFIDI